MHLLKTLTILVVMLFAAGCSNTRDEINSLKESGECRMAEQLIKEKYSGQEELYDLALLYSECDGEKSKGLKILKTLASDEYMPAMARLINLNAASPQMTKRYNVLQCRDQTNSQFYSRKQKISSIARRWTLGGGAKYGSGGIGRASVEADIWADAELSKLAVWKNNDMKSCDSAGTRSNSSFQTMPPPFYEIGKSQNGSNSTSSETDNSPMTIDNSCIQDGGTQMCYNRQSQRYGNSSDNSGISSPYSGVSGQTGISGMSSPYD
jgi:hypothetical protein